MCVSRCLWYVGVCLIPMAIVCILSNILLLFPDLNIHFLWEGHVTSQATWATGVWGSGIMVRTYLSGEIHILFVSKATAAKLLACLCGFFNIIRRWVNNSMLVHQSGADMHTSKT